MDGSLKKLLVCMIYLLVGGILKAQDILITQKGDIINVYQTEISQNSISYTLEDNADAPVIKIAKEDVLMIKKKDGTQLRFHNENVKQTGLEEFVAPDTISSQQQEIKNVANADSKKMREQYNSINVTYIDEQRKHKGKSTLDFYCQLLAMESSQFCDENIEVSFSIGDVKYKYVDERVLSSNYELKPISYIHPSFSPNAPSLQVTVKNKTDNSVYIDLGNTFIKRQSESSPYYVPSATSTTSISTSGGSVNIGSITGAIGIGGALGQLANGINVGGGGGTSSTNTVYSQRVISIPPHSSKKLGEQILFPFNSSSNLERIKPVAVGTQCFIIQLISKEEGQNALCGIELNYTEQDTPFSCGTYITYSFDEAFTLTRHLQTDFYVGKIIGDGNAKTLSPNCNQPLSFTIYRTSKKSFRSVPIR